WEVWNKKAPGNRIWRVTYTRLPSEVVGRAAAADLEEVRRRLQEALVGIRAFALAHDCRSFAECFSRALESLTTNSPHGYHRDLSPGGVLDATATATLDACQSAWVFGGMGSWNDLGFDGQDQEEYERLSESLFQVVILAITTATNTF